MKHSFTTRLLSFVLVFVMVLGMIPANATHVHATEHEDEGSVVAVNSTSKGVTNDQTNIEMNYEHPDYLTDDEGNLVYDKDGNKIPATPDNAMSYISENGRTTTTGLSMDYYWSDNNIDPETKNSLQWHQIYKGEYKATGGKLREYLESKDPDDKYIVIMEDLKATIGSKSDYAPIKIETDKVLDLNGHTIELYDKRNETGNWLDDDQSNDIDDHMTYMFKISKGATLTIIDSNGANVVVIGSNGEISYNKNQTTGRIYANGYMINHQKWDFWYYTHRDIFLVDDGNLVVYGGEYQAGRQKDQFKTGFSWAALREVIGETVTLGTAIFEYASGVSAAKALKDDTIEALYPDDKKNTEDSDDGSEDKDGANKKKDGKGGTTENKNDTPSTAGDSAEAKKAAEAGGKKDQTVAQKQTDNNKKDEENKKGDKSTDNKKDDKKAAKNDKNTKLDELNKGIASAAMDKDKIMGMVDQAFKVGQGLYDLFAEDNKTRATACIHGTVARVSNECTMVIYGGNFIGHGSTPNVRNAVIEVFYNTKLQDVPQNDPRYGKTLGGMVYVFDGTFSAYAGANVFNLYSVNKNQTRDMYQLDENGKVVVIKDVPLSMSESYQIEEIRYDTFALEKWQSVYATISQTAREEYEALETDAERAAYAGLTAAQKKVLDEAPERVDTSNIMVRGGTFRCYYEPSMMCTLDARTKGTDKDEGRYCPTCDKYDDDCDDLEHHRFTGTPGAVNLGVASFDEDLIRDGRIQIVDVYGFGKLVLLDGGDPIDENPNDDGTAVSPAPDGENTFSQDPPENTYTTDITGITQYRLFVGDQELRELTYIEAYPNDAITNSTNSFYLKTYWGSGSTMAEGGWVTDEENTRAPYSANEKYFEYVYDNIGEDNSGATAGVYIVPELNLTDPWAAGEELAQSDVWYYTLPKNHKGEVVGEMSYTDVYMDGDYYKDDGSGVIHRRISYNRSREDGVSITHEDYFSTLDYFMDNYTNLSVSQVKDKSYKTNMKYFTYKVYRVDPLTRENINEGDTWSDNEPLIEIKYGASNESLKCKITLKELEPYIAKAMKEKHNINWTGYQSGEMYRVVFSVEERVGFGYMGTQSHDGEVKYQGELDTATAQTSILFRCSSVNEQKKTTLSNGSSNYMADWTPLQFTTDAIMAGEYNTVNLVNGQTALVDWEGARVFDIYYQWYVLDTPDDPTPTLIAGTENVWVSQSTEGGKQWHDPKYWDIDPATNQNVNGKLTANTIDPNAEVPEGVTYGPNGLPTNRLLWTYDQVHMYTQETAGKVDGMKKDPGKTNLDMGNNNAIWGNSETVYIPDEYAGKYLQVKVVAVCPRYYYLYDNLQTIKSHATLIVDPSMMIPDSQEPEMEVVAVNSAGDTFYAETETYVLGQSKLYGFTPKTLTDNLTLHGYYISATTRVVNSATGDVLYEANNGNLVDLKGIITAQGNYRVEQVQKLMLSKKVVFTRTDAFPITATIPTPETVDFSYAPMNFAVGEEVTFTATAQPAEVAGVDYWYKWVLVEGEGDLEDLTVLQDSSSETFKYTFTDETPVRFGVYAYSKADDGTVSTEGAWNLGYRAIYPSEEMAYTLYVNGEAVEAGSTICVEQNSDCEIEIVINGGAGDVKCVAYKGWTALGEQTTINPSTAEVGKTGYSFHYSDADVSTQADITIEVCAPLAITNKSSLSVNIGYATNVDLWVQYTGTGTTVKFQYYDASSGWIDSDLDVITRMVSSTNKEYRSVIAPSISTTGTHKYRAVVTDMFGNSETALFNVTYSATNATNVAARFYDAPTVTVFDAYDYGTDDRCHDAYTDLVFEITAKFDKNPTSDLYAADRTKYGLVKPTIGKLTGKMTIKYYESYEAYIANYNDYTVLCENVECMTGTVASDGTATWTYDADLADAVSGEPGFYVCTIDLYNNGKYAYFNGEYSKVVIAEYLLVDPNEEHQCNYTYKITPNEDGETHTWYCVCGETQTVDHAWSTWKDYYTYIDSVFTNTNLQQRYCAEASSNATVGGWCNTYQYRLAHVDTLTLDQTQITDPGLSGQFQLNASLEFVDIAEGVDMTGKTLVDPETGLIWTSSNDKVATVDENGLVTIVGSGTATITVTSVANTKDKTPATATCTIIIDCDHENVSVNAAKASDCTTAGWLKHYVCNFCGAYSLDGTFTDDVDYDTDIALALKAHEPSFVLSYDATGHWYGCRYGCGAKMGTVHDHTFNVDSVSCENEVKYCTTCTYEAARHTHNNGFVPAKAASCGNDGNIEHYACFNCGKMFADLAGTEPLTEAEVKISGGVHNWIGATCTTPGTCAVCGTTQGTAIGHTWIEATCLNPKHCANCSATEGSALAHTWIDATCRDPKTCSVCGVTEGDPLPHTYGEATCAQGATCTVCGWIGTEPLAHTLTHVPAVAVTCTTDGNVEYWSCSICGNKYADMECENQIEDVIIPAPGHNFVDGVCTRCGAEEPVAGTITITSQPVDYVGLIGDIATFTVVAEGEGLSYQWYYYEAASNEWKKSGSGTSATLSVEYTAYRNNQQYRCEITDANGSTVTTNIVRLTPKSVELIIVTQPVDYV
ncbi:MAG: Ig-like domain-containing protein, partial [Oscillospiraceae bacterium]|nr:Ig-like domain-containing protein [Oscillospiraceae bacterium]